MANTGLPSVSVQVLLEHSHVQSFMYCLLLILPYNSRVEQLVINDKNDQQSLKYLLSDSTESLLTTALEW